MMQKVENEWLGTLDPCMCEHPWSPYEHPWSI